MAEDKKNLRISAKVDEKGLRSFDAALRSIDKKLTGLDKKLAKLTENFKKLSQSLKGDVSKGFEKADKNIDNNTKSMDKAINTSQKLTKSYQNMQRAISGGINGALNGAQIMPVGNGGFVLIPGGGGTRGTGGGPGGPGGSNGGGASGRNARLARMANSAYILSSQVAGISGLIQNQKTQQFANLGSVQSYGTNLYNEAKAGDIGSLYAFLQANKKGVNVGSQAGGTGAAIGKIAGDTGSQLAQGAQNVLHGNVGGFAQMGAGAAHPFIASANNQKMVIEADSLKRISSDLKTIYGPDISKIQQLQAIAPALLNANRRLSGAGLRAAYMGAAQGMDAGSAMNFFVNGANQFGANVMMGGGLGTSALALQRKGFDVNGMTSSIGNIQSLLSGTNQNRVKEANTMIVDAISRGVAMGIKDPQTLEALSTSIASANNTINGAMTNSGALANALTAGLNGNTANPALINQRFQGLNAISGITNVNPVLRNRAYAAATQLLGNSSDMVARSALVNSSMTDLIGGNMTLSALLPGDAKQQFKERQDFVKSIIKDQVSLAAQHNSAVRSALSHKSAMEVLKDHGLRAKIFATLKTANGGSSTLLPFEATDSALQFANAKFDNRHMNNLAGLSNQGGTALTAEVSRAEAFLKPISQLFKDKDKLETATKAFQGLGSFMDSIGNLQTGDWENAEKVAAAIEHLANTLNGVDVKNVQHVEEKVRGVTKGGGSGVARTVRGAPIGMSVNNR